MNAEQRQSASIFWADEGFSTVGMALALLLTLALLFTCARVYEVQSASAQIQDVADAAALAAENTVAEFYLVAQLCDALVFTLSLGMVASLGIGVVCACVPPAKAFSKAFLDAAKKLKDARDSFYEKASESLDSLQKALPFLATVKAQQVFQANGDEGSYAGFVVLAPWESDEEESDLDTDAEDDAFDSVMENEEQLSETAEKAEEAAQRANEYLQLAYEHDSGSRDSYCMYERAATLAGMSGAENPFFSSVETWSFASALERSKTYYRARWEKEAPQGTSVNERANSALRKRFYAYAIGQVNKGYVNETDGSFDAYFPLLPKNTEEMKGTELYVEAVYPRTESDGHYTLHAWSGCPGVSKGTAAGVASIQDMDGNPAYETCSRCEFVPSSMGSVAAASTNIDNGFEYHYNIVAKAAGDYQQARSVADPLSQQVKESASSLFDQIEKALSAIAAQRIKVSPPGHFGAIAMVADSSQVDSSFESAFVQSGQTLGTRAAVSAATLVKEESDEGSNIITSFLDGMRADGGSALGAARVVLELWSGLLGVYARGEEALSGAIESSLDAIPLASASGLGTWASSQFQDLVAAAGLDAPDLRANKAVVVNSSYVASADDSAFSARFLSVKNSVLQAGSNVSIGGALASVERSASAAIDDLSQEFEIASIEVFDGAVSIPITISLPVAVTGSLKGTLQGGINALRSFAASVTGVRQWE